jgi:hypothetical protein
MRISNIYALIWLGLKIVYLYYLPIEISIYKSNKTTSIVNSSSITGGPGCIPCNRHAEGFKIYNFFTPRNLKFYASRSQKAKRKQKLANYPI